MIRTRLAIVFTLVITALLLAGCNQEEQAEQEESDAQQEAEQEDAEAQADAVSVASIVDTGQEFIEAAGADGTWIIATTEDVSLEQEIVVAGEFTRRGEIYRKIALYAQDDDRNVTDRYTLTAPRMVVRSENTRIQSGTFVGDVYVEAPSFHLLDARVDGDIYFENESLRDSFEHDNESEISGELQIGSL